MLKAGVMMVINAQHETETQTPDARTHSKMLTFWLGLLGVLHTYVALASAATWLDPVQRQDPAVNGGSEWTVVLMILYSMVNIGAVVALWKWRKIGFHIMVIAAIPGVLLFYFAFGVQFLMALFPVYSLSTTWTLVQAKWKLFE